MTDFGYAGKLLRIDLSNGRIENLETSVYAGRFLGGRGIAAKLYWDETSPDIKAFDPENPLICITGPVAGFTGFAGCRWQICGKSPSTKQNMFSYANLGGSWGAWLKYAGYDGLIIKGRADVPSYLAISDDTVQIHDASRIWGKTVRQASELLKDTHGNDACIMTIGPAGENLVTFATVQAAESASGSGGFGAVMGSKNLKAVVINASAKNKIPAANQEDLKSLAKQVFELRSRNFEDYEHILPLTIQQRACYGCIMGCTRGYYRDEKGYEYKSQCQASGVYFGPAMRYYGGMNEQAIEVGRLATRLCDDYGLDTVVVAPMIGWLGRCWKEGLLSDESTGLPLSRSGSEEFIREFSAAVSFRKGFGDILAGGTISAADHLVIDHESPLYPKEVTEGNESMDYDPRYIPANAMIYATEPRRAIQLLHAVSLPLSRWNNWLQKWDNAGLASEVFYDIAETYWGSREAGNMLSFRDKTEASKLIQDYGYVRESMILCDLAWPIWQVRDIDNSIKLATLESRMVTAITGRDIDERELLKIGERNFNLQRAVLVRDGWNGIDRDVISDYLYNNPFKFVFFSAEALVPGENGQPVSMKGTVVDQKDFEFVKKEFYRIRGWDEESGMQTKWKMIELDLQDIAGDLQNRGLISTI